MGILTRCASARDVLNMYEKLVLNVYDSCFLIVQSVCATVLETILSFYRTYNEIPTQKLILYSPR